MSLPFYRVELSRNRLAGLKFERNTQGQKCGFIRGVWEKFGYYSRLTLGFGGVELASRLKHAVLGGQIQTRYQNTDPESHFKILEEGPEGATMRFVKILWG